MPRVKRPVMSDALPAEMSLEDRAREEKLISAGDSAIEQAIAKIESKAASSKDLAMLSNMVQQLLTQRALRRRYQASSGMSERQIAEDPAKAKETVVAYLASLKPSERVMVLGDVGEKTNEQISVMPRGQFTNATVTSSTHAPVDLDTF